MTDNFPFGRTRRKFHWSCGVWSRTAAGAGRRRQRQGRGIIFPSNDCLYLCSWFVVFTFLFLSFLLHSTCPLPACSFLFSTIPLSFSSLFSFFLSLSSLFSLLSSLFSLLSSLFSLLSYSTNHRYEVPLHNRPLPPCPELLGGRCSHS